MLCCACGLRHQPLPHTGYCAQCDCPLGALAPPPSLDRRLLRPQRLLPRAEGPSAESLAQAGLLFSALCWLPLPLGAAGCAVAVLLASAALRQARAHHRHGAVRLAWAALVVCGVLSVPALAGL